MSRGFVGLDGCGSLLLVGGRGWLVLGFAACACVIVFVCCVVPCHAVCRASLLDFLFVVRNYNDTATTAHNDNDNDTQRHTTNQPAV